MKESKAEILQEYGPFGAIRATRGVTFDGQNVWFAADDKLLAFDPQKGEIAHSIDVTAHAGTAFDGRYLFQIANDKILKIDAKNGQVVTILPAPEDSSNSGLAWAEGSLWVGNYRGRKVYQVDPNTGVVLKCVESERHVTGVTWAGGELWYGTAEDDTCDIRRVHAATGAMIERIEMPSGTMVGGLESDGANTFYCATVPAGKILAIRKPSA